MKYSKLIGALMMSSIMVLGGCASTPAESTDNEPTTDETQETIGTTLDQASKDLLNGFKDEEDKLHTDVQAMIDKDTTEADFDAAKADFLSVYQRMYDGADAIYTGLANKIADHGELSRDLENLKTETEGLYNTIKADTFNAEEALKMDVSKYMEAAKNFEMQVRSANDLK